MAEFLNYQEVADELRVSVRTVRRLCKGGAMEYIKIGNQVRISREALDDYVESVTHEPMEIRL